MTRDSLVFGLAGTIFGVLLGWIIGSQQAGPPVAPPAPAPAAASNPSGTAAAPSLDTARLAQLQQQAAAEPANASVRSQIGNLFFDAQQYDQAATWYEQSLALDPKNIDVSTDLGVAYYSMNRADQALAQFEKSLALDPRHLKTLLNQGIVRAFGKQDLKGAVESWQKVVAIAPSSEEAKRAQQGLEGVKSAHPELVPGPAPQTP